MNIKILWADDEIEHLKAQIHFLEGKGYQIDAVTNGYDAIDKVKDNHYDLVFLDEHMPGISGLETLPQIKELKNDLPVVMITKNEEEDIFDEAIGSQIADYLIKPVKSSQILLTIKKIIDNRRLVTEKTNSAYQQQFQKIFMAINNQMDQQEWAELYRKMIYWELELEKARTQEMAEIMTMQKAEANKEFFKFVSKNYQHWLHHPNDSETPVLSHTLFKKKVIPVIDDTTPTFFILIDNLRYDQWKVIEPIFSNHFKKVKEEHFYSILPTTTQYSRNAIFSGLMPSEIERKYRDKWIHDEESEGKNLYEEEFVQDQLARSGIHLKQSYTKITNSKKGKELVDNILNLVHNPFNVIVYNFVDMLSHARTEMEVLKELAGNESAYRSLTLSWIDHSPLLQALQKLEGRNARIIITTDHGTIRVQTPSKVIGDKNTTTNLRYKTGKNLNYSDKDVYAITNPDEVFLPKSNLSSSYIFAKEDVFFAYPNNYNYYVNYYKNTFQHGGVSLEEVIVPFVIYESK
ncbi:MAG: PglZ domain-containing protein [Chitinophagales bacterium]